jgi:hypothetical protein
MNFYSFEWRFCFLARNCKILKAFSETCTLHHFTLGRPVTFDGGQGNQIGRICFFGDCSLLAVYTKLQKSPNFWVLFSTIKVMRKFWQKMGWATFFDKKMGSATFWVTFWRAHLVTLMSAVDGRLSCANTQIRTSFRRQRTFYYSIIL